MGITNVFGKTFRILRDNPRIIIPNLIFSAFIGSLALYFVFSNLSSLYGINALQSAGVHSGAHLAGGLSAMLPFLAALVPFMAIVYLISFFVGPVLYGMYISIAEQGYGKKKVSLRTAWHVAAKNYYNLLATEVLVSIIWIVFVAVLAAIFVVPAVLAIASPLVGAWLGIGTVIFIVGSVLIGIALYEAFAVVIMERLGAFKAIKRSIAIGKRYPCKVFKIFLLALLIVVVYAILISIFQAALEIAFAFAGIIFAGAIIAQAVNFVLNSAVGSWISMVPLGFYLDYVRRRAAVAPRRKARARRRRR